MKQILAYMTRLAPFALVALTGCGSKQETPPPPRTVETVIVGGAAGTVTKVYPGQVVSRHSGNYAFRVAGAILARPVEVGQEVAAGQVLARLDTRDASVNVRSAAAQTYGAQAQAITQDADLARARKLLAQGFISPAEFDRNRAAAASAEAQLRAAREQQAGARQQLAYTVLRAARAGVVSAATAEVGEVVAAGQTVVSIDSPGSPEVAISIPEDETALVRGSRIVVRFPGGTDRWQAAGTLRTLSGAANPQTRTFDARIAFAPPSGFSTIGRTAEVVLSRAVVQADIRVPLAAVVALHGRPVVWIVSGQPATVRPRAVVVRSTQANDVLIEAGLRPGERIVSAGGQFLAPGQTVRPVASTIEQNR